MTTSQVSRSAYDIEQELRTHPSIEQIVDAYALSHFARAARYLSGYEAAAEWKEMIKPTEEGKRLLEAGTRTAPAADAHMALLGYFSHHGLLIDVDRSELKGIPALIASDTVHRRSLFPSVFGRELLDRFDQLHPDGHIAELTAEETVRLLEDTPIGVVQVGTLVLGPFGIVRSSETRLLRAETTTLRLLHTREDGRQRSQNVSLSIFDKNPIAVAYSAIGEAAGGDPSSWESAIESCIQKRGNKYNKSVAQIPFLLGQCLAPAELGKLLAHVLATSDGATLRATISRQRNAEQSAGKPADIASRLSVSEMLQLMMVLPDSTIVRHLDAACRSVLKLHFHELRGAHSVSNVARFSFLLEFGPRLGAHGARDMVANGPARLASALVSAYTNAGMLSDLVWKTRPSAGDIVGDVISYIARVGPRATVSQLAFVSRKVRDDIHDLLDISVKPDSDLDDELQILWI